MFVFVMHDYYLGACQKQEVTSLEPEIIVSSLHTDKQRTSFSCPAIVHRSLKVVIFSENGLNFLELEWEDQISLNRKLGKKSEISP